MEPSTPSLVPYDFALVSVHYDSPRNWMREAIDLLGPRWHWFFPERSPAVFEAMTANVSSGYYPAAQVTVSVDTANWGYEASGYLRHIIDYYDRLPNVTVFTHGNPMEHSFYFLNIMRCANAAFDGYTTINVGIVADRYQHNGNYDRFVDDVNAALVAARLAGPNAPVAANGASGMLLPHVGTERITFSCCAQFLASRSAIRRHPKAFYEILLRFVMDSSYFKDGPWAHMPGRDQAIVVEHMWHVILGGENLVCSFPEDICRPNRPFIGSTAQCGPVPGGNC